MRFPAFAALALLALACGAPEVRDITQDELLSREPSSVIVLDVRSESEFASGHVPGARNIPHDELAGRLAELGDADDTPVVVYCERGRRAGLAGDVLTGAGFDPVLHLAGDMTAWRESGHPIETSGAERIGALRSQAAGIFGPLPSSASSPDRPTSDAKVALGRMLYYDTRLSKNHDISCNSCHLLSEFGQDGEPTSPGHRGQRGGRNSPTVFNAALHVAQFWDGRAADVEEQAKGPVLNPIEMAMPDEAAVLAVLQSIPGYVDAFGVAFPDADDPITYDHMAAAIGAFERGLVTPGRFDAFLGGDDDALTPAELDGLETFVASGCITCHVGPTVGGTLYQKLGLARPYPTEDAGRFDVTGNEADRGFFKVPSLRNVAETGPYFHDGSIDTLERAVSIMAEHQLAKTLTDEENASIRAFLSALTGDVDAGYVARPELPPSGPETPAPDPS